MLPLSNHNRENGGCEEMKKYEKPYVKLQPFRKESIITTSPDIFDDWEKEDNVIDRASTINTTE